MQDAVKIIADLAREIESEDPIDWGLLQIDENTAYELMASQVIEKFNDADKITMIATITKLVVENFTLHLKLKGFSNDN